MPFAKVSFAKVSTSNIDYLDSPFTDPKHANAKTGGKGSRVFEKKTRGVCGQEKGPVARDKIKSRTGMK